MSMLLGEAYDEADDSSERTFHAVRYWPRFGPFLPDRGLLFDRALSASAGRYGNYMPRLQRVR
jgi:hypothetical protein